MDGRLIHSSVSRARDVPRISDICKVLFGNPCTPVALKRSSGSRRVLQFTEGPLVDDGVVTGIIEQAGRNPWL